MDDFLKTMGLIVLGMAIALMLVIVGIEINEERIEDDCLYLGGFKVDNHDYDCNVRREAVD